VLVRYKGGLYGKGTQVFTGIDRAVVAGMRLVRTDVTGDAYSRPNEYCDGSSYLNTRGNGHTYFLCDCHVHARFHRDCLSHNRSTVRDLGSCDGFHHCLTNISQYFHPVGAPQASWDVIPIMSQATAGQEFQANIYSYIAAATLNQAHLFVAGKAQSLGLIDSPATGSAGSGSQATHSVTFISYRLTIVLTSFDNDTGHIIVVISTVP
jgi:hypothetical protein